ncbi:BatA (Bacteroides aerotolerance operon) [hydrothermal vent metagenome]|uniref:BatA (Bacteroides aerotolerance operon) n=1 Tax=hydrothermal vent metagenome TaxID=652676 RepID=A0A1W1CC44_9ZZZZ
MTFANPELFWILIIPLVIFYILISTNKDNLSKIFSDEVLKRLSAGDNSIPMSIRHTLLFISISLMILAMARPIEDKGEKIVEVKGLSLLTAIDISGSMRSKDIYPNRLEFSKKKIISLFKAMPSDEISVIAFAHSSFILAPFSSDKDTLEQIVEGVNEDYISMGSTDFSALGRLTGKVLEKKEPKILVVVSDGGDKKALEGFSDIVKNEHIKLYVILIGTKEGAPVIDKNGNPITKPDGTIAISQRDDDLGEIAVNSGGAFVVATNGDKDIKELVKTIKSQNKNTQKSKVNIKDRVEYFYYPLSLSLLFLLLGLSSLPVINRKNND